MEHSHLRLNTCNEPETRPCELRASKEGGKGSQRYPRLPINRTSLTLTWVRPRHKLFPHSRPALSAGHENILITRTFANRYRTPTTSSTMNGNREVQRDSDLTNALQELEQARVCQPPRLRCLFSLTPLSLFFAAQLAALRQFEQMQQRKDQDHQEEWMMRQREKTKKVADLPNGDEVGRLIGSMRGTVKALGDEIDELEVSREWSATQDRRDEADLSIWLETGRRGSRSTSFEPLG